MEKLKPGSGSIAGKILELGGGVPGNNTKLTGHVIGEPPNIPNELEVVQSLLTDVIKEIEERLRPMVEAICILQVFFPEDVVPLVQSHPILGGQWDESKIKEMFLEIKQIQIGPGGLVNWDKNRRSWAMDEPTRTLFERELKMRDPELWKKLHCVAYQMYKQWGEEFNSQLYKDKTTYHQQCLQSAGMECD